jgi:hypothetical protein
MCSTTTPTTKTARGASGMESKQLQQNATTGGDSDEEQQRQQQQQQQQSPTASKDIELAVPLLIEKKKGDDDADDDDDDDTPDGSTSPSNKHDTGSLEWVIRNTKKNAKVLSACSFYSFCSVSMVLVNKSLASR